MMEEEGEHTIMLSAECRALQGAEAARPTTAETFHLAALPGPMLDVHERQELGCVPPPLCGTCKGCDECSRLRLMSKEERTVLERVEKEMKLGPDGKLVASYPWTPAAEKMVSNRGQALAVQQKIEARAVASGQFARLVEAVNVMIEAGTLRIISREELATYSGPVHYVTIFPVYKEDSVTTKVRVCTNSAMPNKHSGLSLNDVMYKGPDLMAGLLRVMIHWRTVEVAVLFDLTKAYWQIKTREKELHLRRVLWRNSDKEDWTTYGITCATFGDLIAGVLLEVARRRAAVAGTKLGEAIRVEADLETDADKANALSNKATHMLETARQVGESVYVDDGAVGGNRSLVNAMVGTEGDAEEGLLSQVLDTVGLKAKYTIVSGDPSPEAADKLGDKVLGLQYELKDDRIKLTINIKYKETNRYKERVEVMLSTQDILDILNNKRKWTRRNALSFMMQIFDPLNILTPVLL